MATDIALAVGVMTFGGRVRPTLKLFLLALAIVDDIGAILVIGVFDAGHIELGWIVAASAAVALLRVLQLWRVEVLWVYLVAGCGLWLALHHAGIHATLAGVILGLLAPTKPHLSPELIDQNELTNISSVRDALLTTRLARSAVSVVEWLEHRLHPWTSFLIVPIFALANAGISLSAESVRAAVISPVTWGVVMGLLIGKPLGILAASALAVRLGAAALPVGVSWTGICGAGLLAGVGFTVSLFMAEVALGSTQAVMQDWEFSPPRSRPARSDFSSCAGSVAEARTTKRRSWADRNTSSTGRWILMLSDVTITEPASSRPIAELLI